MNVIKCNTPSSPKVGNPPMVLGNLYRRDPGSDSVYICVVSRSNVGFSLVNLVNGTFYSSTSCFGEGRFTDVTDKYNLVEVCND